jgi:signal transduction histidine kinase
MGRDTPVPMPDLYRTLADNSPHGIGIWHAPTDDPGDMVLVWINKQGGTNVGEPLESYFGKTMRELEGTPVDALPELRPTLIKVAHGGPSDQGAKLVSGESLEYGGTIFRVYFQPLGDRMVAVIFEDATEEYQAVQKFKARELKARQALESQAEDLKRSNRDLEQFAYVASHDLQEPLRMVSSYCSLLEEEYGSKLDEDALTYIQYAVDGATRMKTLIEGLLEFSRVGRNSTFIWFQMDDALDDALAILDCTNGCPSIIRDTLPEVYGDKAMISRLFLNLVGNALKFKKDDESLVIRITCEESQLKWKFAVRDNGVGFDQQYADRIFQIFQRLGTLKSGTGIGLAICKKILDRHAGAIWAESAAGEGSTFFFTLGKL